MVVFSLSSQCCDYGLVRFKHKAIWRGVRKKKITVWLKLHVLVATVTHGNDQTSLKKDPGIYVVTKLSVNLKDTWGHFQLLIYSYMCGYPQKYPEVWTCGQQSAIWQPCWIIITLTLNSIIYPGDWAGK